MYIAPVKLLTACVVSLLAISSWALTFADYPARSAKDCAVVSRALGVTIGVEAVESADAQEAYFHMEFAKKGFLPVFIVIENTAADSVIFDKTKMSYGAAGSLASTPPTAPRAPAMFVVSAIPIVGMAASIDIIPKASEIRENVLRKEIRSTTLSPGASARGFLYVPIPKKGGRGNIILHIPITRAGTDNTFDVNLVI